jgi:hypothetical protein
VAGPDESLAVDAEREDFPAPDGLVASVTRAVEGDPDDRFTDAPVLGQQRHHVRVVVLNEVQRSTVRAALRPISGVIPGMQVGGQPCGLTAYLAELAHRPLERAQRLPGAHVADVPGQVGARAVGEAEGVLQFPADGQHRRALDIQVDRQRRIPAGPADRQFAPVDHPHHGVVTWDVDRAVVVEDGIAQGRKSL